MRRLWRLSFVLLLAGSVWAEEFSAEDLEVIKNLQLLENLAVAEEAELAFELLGTQDIDEFNTVMAVSE